MKRYISPTFVCVVVLGTLLSAKTSSAYCQTDIAGGNVSGVWTKAGSPYHVNGEVTVPEGETLTIDPGVEVVFTGHYKFNVQGRLLSIGAPRDTILFTAQDPGIGWGGIRFENTASTNDSSRITYCTLRYGKANAGSYSDRSGGAISVSNFSKLMISNCMFHHNMNSGDPAYTGGGAISLNAASPILMHCTISHNDGTTGGGILCWSDANPIISDNIISSNNGIDGGGLYIGISSPLVVNNVIVDNHSADNGGGLRCWASNALIINGTIVNNSSGFGGGIDCSNGSDPIILNTIAYGNSAGSGNNVYLGNTNSDPHFLFCDIEGGKDGFGGPGAGASYLGAYEHNFDANPLFKATAEGDFHLSDSSPCINAGTDSAQVGTTWYVAPGFDCEGSPRPNPVNSEPDIGAFESSLGTPTSVTDEELLDSSLECRLFQNFPNPVNPSTVIRYRVPLKGNEGAGAGEVRLVVYDLLGQEVAVLVNGRREAGYHQVVFDASGLSSGVYIYRLEAGNFVQSRKLTLLR